MGLRIVSRLGLGGRDVFNRLEQASIREPIDPLEGRKFHGLCAAPRAAAMDRFGFEQAVDGLCKRIVIAVVDAADGGFDPGLRQSFGIANADILTAAVAMVTRPPCRTGRRSHSACSSASSTKSVRADRDRTLTRKSPQVIVHDNGMKRLGGSLVIPSCQHHECSAFIPPAGVAFDRN
jgi:hypothetical protein